MDAMASSVVGERASPGVAREIAGDLLQVVDERRLRFAA
jgi:hypothetical protein